MGEPHPAIDHTLDAMDIDLTRTIFGGEAAIVEFLGRRRLPNDSSSRCPLVTIQSSPTLVIMWWQALTDLATNLSTRGEVQDRQGNTENYTTLGGLVHIVILDHSTYVLFLFIFRFVFCF